MDKSMNIIISMLAIAILLAIAFTYFASNEINNDVEFKSRPIYKGINQSTFEDLPEYPVNMTIMKRDIYAGQITDLSKVSESIWKQPEFYPTWERNGLIWFTQHDYSRWGVHGYGFFPGKISYNVINMTAMDEVIITSFLHTSWGIETWQGLRLVPEYNFTLFDVSVYPDTILLEPTFPKFYENWTQKITMKIVANQKIPKGIHNFTVSFSSPSSEQSNIWVWEVIDRYTDNQYHDEIVKCINTQTETEQCQEFIELRQNKYITGNEFAPSQQYTVILNVI